MITLTNKPLVACLLLGTSMLSVAQGGTGAYFGDIETSAGNVFQAGTWSDPQSPSNIVLNEFLPNPDTSANGLNFGDDNDSNPLGEWVELYNNGDEPINIVNWYLSDESGGAGNTQAIVSASNTQPATTTIPAHGWLVIYFNKPVLNNTGDTIFLYTDTNILVDSYAYNDPSAFCELEPTPTGSNSTSTPSGSPTDDDCIENQVAPNKSYARIPDGTGAWVDPIPTPGAPNELEEDAMPPEPASTEALEVEVSEEPLEVVVAGTSTPEEEPTVEVRDEPLEILPPPSSSSEEGGEEVPTPALEGEGEPAQSEPEPTPEPETTPEAELELTPEPESEPESTPEIEEAPAPEESAPTSAE